VHYASVPTFGCIDHAVHTVCHHLLQVVAQVQHALEETYHSDENKDVLW
jgi:hypothetical protein